MSNSSDEHWLGTDTTDVCRVIKRILYCAYKLELIVADVIRRYADIASETYIRAVLSIISLESQKHSQYLELIGKEFNLFEENINCRELVGKPWEVIENLQAELSRSTQLSLREFIERQAWLERTVGEETYHKILVPPLTRGLTECRLDNKVLIFVTNLLDKMASEEKQHEEWFLDLLRSFCT